MIFILQYVATIGRPQFLFPAFQIHNANLFSIILNWNFMLMKKNKII